MQPRLSLAKSKWFVENERAPVYKKVAPREVSDDGCDKAEIYANTLLRNGLVRETLPLASFDSPQSFYGSRFEVF